MSFRSPNSVNDLFFYCIAQTSNKMNVTICFKNYTLFQRSVIHYTFHSSPYTEQYLFQIRVNMLLMLQAVRDPSMNLDVSDFHSKVTFFLSISLCLEKSGEVLKKRCISMCKLKKNYFFNWCGSHTYKLTKITHLIWIFSVCCQPTVTFYSEDYLYNCLDLWQLQLVFPTVEH